jgi:hypothetical protein
MDQSIHLQSINGWIHSSISQSTHESIHLLVNQRMNPFIY